MECRPNYEHDKMSKVTVLGGSGSVGSTAVRTLASTDIFSEIEIGDLNVEKAKQVAEETDPEKVSTVKVDATDKESIKNAIEGSDVVLNCIGPFYKFGVPILKAVMETGIDYVDVCDDMDATEDLLELDDEAKDAGISALVGMGTSPGLANLLIKFCADSLLDDVQSIDIYHSHGGEEEEGPAVVKHRIHSMEMPIPVFDEGEYKRLDLFSEEGKKYEETVEFKNVGTYDVYLYPHPETITLPEYIEGVERVTNLGLVLPPQYAEYIKGMVRLGLTSEEPIEVQGQEVVPLDFAVASILDKRPEFLEEAGMSGPRGCLRIDVAGENEDGEERTYVFQLSSESQGMGEGTGIPAALGAMLMNQGKITKEGVLPPEGCVNPGDALELAKETVEAGEGDEGEGLPLQIEKIDGKGNVEEIDTEGMF